MLCVVALKALITELCFMHQKIGKRIFFSDDITFITLSRSSDLL